jgi:hypothetical protein
LGYNNSDGEVNNTGEKIGTTTKSSVCLVRALDLFLWHPTLVLELGILGFVGKHAFSLLSDSLGWRWLKGCFLFFSLSLVLWAIHCKWEL